MVLKQGREREEGLQRGELCCQDHIDFGRSDRLPPIECGPGEIFTAEDHKHSK